MVFGSTNKQEQDAIFFSKSTTEASRNQIKDALGIVEINQYEKYLGLPSFVGRKKK